MLPLVSKTRPTATGSSSIANWVMACSTRSSKTRKCSFSRPVTGRLSWSLTETGIRTRLVSTRMSARDCSSFGGGGRLRTVWAWPTAARAARMAARREVMPSRALYLFAADAAFALPNERDEVARLGGRDLGLDADQRVVELEAGAIEQVVGLLERGEIRGLVPRALESDDVEALGGDIEIGVEEEGRHVAVHTGVAPDHGEAPDFGELVDDDAAGDERLVLDFDIPRQQGATGDDDMVTDLAVVRNVAGAHDEVFVADFGDGLGRGAAADGVVLANLVAVAEPEVAALAGEALVERVGAEDGAGGDLVPLAQGRPALDVDVRFQHAVGADDDVALDDAEVGDADARSDDCVGVHAGRRGDRCGGVDCHGNGYGNATAVVLGHNRDMKLAALLLTV